MAAITPPTLADMAEQVDQICELSSMTRKLAAVADGYVEVLSARLGAGNNDQVDHLIGLVFSLSRQLEELDDRAWKLSDGMEKMNAARPSAMQAHAG